MKDGVINLRDCEVIKMILQSLVQHYEMLADKGKVTKPGWCSAKVSYAIRLGIDGTCVGNC